MPISDTYKSRLYPHLDTIAERFGTPFHIYDEAGIRQTVKQLQHAFRAYQFKEFFAVKALPNPQVLRLLRESGCGFDCSSIPELMLSRVAGAQPHDIMFTSNNTSQNEFRAALSKGGSIINLDDDRLLDKMPRLPDVLSFRVNLGSDMGNDIIGKPEEAKFGIPRERIINAYRQAQAMGITRFGLHTMTVSSERDYTAHLNVVRELCAIGQHIQDELGIQLEFINIGGGLGIPYHPDDTPLDIVALAEGIKQCWLPDVRLYMEAGRYITGNHGVLVTRVINTKSSYREYVGVDASMSALMRPAMYGAYHHMDVIGKKAQARDDTQVVDVVGALCENNDKFAIQRELPVAQVGDFVVIHDTGAHGHAMGFNYNGRLRPQELMLRSDGVVELIRRAETMQDYFATLDFEPRRVRITP